MCRPLRQRRGSLADRFPADDAARSENIIRKNYGASRIRASLTSAELKKYAIVYTAFSRDGPGVSLALTEDFHTFERYGVIMSPEDKDAALLPHRIGGQWALIHRPVSAPRAHMWMSFSARTCATGASHKLMLEARRGAWWDANKIGLSPPPIEHRKAGW